MTKALVWFRQDLRLADNPALFEACRNHETVIPIYILDEKNSVLGQAQAWWLHHSLQALSKSLVTQFGVRLILRNKKIKATLQESGINVLSFNGSLLNEPWTIKNKSGDYFKVFTPYFRIFNPVLQSQKFDPNGVYIRRWLPQLASLDKLAIHAPWESKDAASIYSTINYPKPIINHKESRLTALDYYSKLKKRTSS